MIADLAGRVAFVTGAASGIGRACVECLLEQGATVEATDVDEATLTRVVDDLGSARVHGSPLDVTDADEVRRCVAEAATRHGRIEILVCSAGVVLADDRDRQVDPAADWHRCMAVNLYGTIHACEAALPHLRDASDAAIVTIGSISAHASRQTAGAYPTSKAAALRYAKGLALTLAPDIRVNAVCPGAVWTGMQARIAAQIQKSTGGDAPDHERTFFERYEAVTPMKRPQTPVDVAKAVAFLASSDASNITGQCLHVDGGAVVGD